MSQNRLNLATAVAALVMAAMTTGASALAPETVTQRESLRSRFARAQAQPALFEAVDGQYRPDGIPATLYTPDFTARVGSPHAMALEYLAARGAQLGLDASAVAGLRVASERIDGGIGVVRVQQQAQGLPVYGSDIVVSTAADGRVIFVANDAVSGIADIDATPTLQAATAVDLAAAYLGGQPLRAQSTELNVHVADGRTHLVWRARITSSDVGTGGWDILVDAHDGSVLRAASTTYNVDGTGTVFRPDPLSSARAAATDPGYADNNNADSPQFTAQLFSVALRDITLAGGQHSLTGPYASCWQWEAPNDAACPVQASGNFSVTRSALTFDAVNVYYHVDAFLRYVNLTLGVAAMPTRHYPGGVRYDAHGEDGADNSHYNSGTGELVFGEGDVDDAQDADVVIHELGHGIHDWVTNGGLSQQQGLSEGVGDYLAQAYSRDFPNQWTPADAAYNWVFNFDGHAPTLWAGRVTNWHIGHSYPGNLGSSIHLQGQYWASCNIVARDAIGGVAMDKAFLAGLSMTNGSSNQKAAAQAVINAAATQGANVAAIAQAYNTSCNYAVTVPALPDLIFRNSFDSTQ
ncbi:M4 family metallopeptidase [Tahibacter sp.]|uniref:M4 family metallopeptidase n=1 Tax=Tahibacter sp. TaxID=2056211 RepID=UPI0028C3F9CD|nr:M4 family metallopeptidase [Tahibacter sp.]